MEAKNMIMVKLGEMSKFTNRLNFANYFASSKLKITKEKIVSEGIDANYQDMINYSIFALI
jgi:hypothetical protein